MVSFQAPLTENKDETIQAATNKDEVHILPSQSEEKQVYTRASEVDENTRLKKKPK